MSQFKRNLQKQQPDNSWWNNANARKKERPVSENCFAKRCVELYQEGNTKLRLTNSQYKDRKQHIQLPESLALVGMDFMPSPSRYSVKGTHIPKTQSQAFVAKTPRDIALFQFDKSIPGPGQYNNTDFENINYDKSKNTGFSNDERFPYNKQPVNRPAQSQRALSSKTKKETSIKQQKGITIPKSNRSDILGMATHNNIPHMGPESYNIGKFKQFYTAPKNNFIQ